jgi:hypothetical protein
MATLLSLSQRRLIRVFIASPGDLGPERQRAREVADELNSTLGRQFNVEIDLLGWEDTLPGVGRPQALINSDVDNCDLFIGLLWKHWGTPSGRILALVSKKNLSECGDATSVQANQRSG